MNFKDSETILSSKCEILKKNDNNENINEQFLNLDIEFYQAYVIEFKTGVPKIHTLESNKLKQVRIQFLYKEKSAQTLDKLLVLVHQECKLYVIKNI